MILARTVPGPIAAAFLAAAVLLAPAAHAGVADCTGQPDQTPCSTTCRVNGTCLAGACTGGTTAPDGTPCASGDLCTTDDTCKSGACLGKPRACFPQPCQAATCDPKVGCVYFWICDGPAPADLTTTDASPSDLTLADAGRSDAADAGPEVGRVRGGGLRCSMAAHTTAPVEIALAALLLVGITARSLRRRA